MRTFAPALEATPRATSEESKSELHGALAERVTSTPGPSPRHACPCGGGCPKCRAARQGSAPRFANIQAHPAEGAAGPLAVGPTDDAFEREAEATADAISQGRAAPLPVPRPQSAGTTAPGRTSGHVLPGGGEALDEGVRRAMEPRLGFDLGGVRVHRGDAAAAAATALSARAFTVGTDIAFAPGEFRPDTTSGRRLLAHELAHVAQQAQAGTPLVQRQPATVAEPWETKVKDILPQKVGLIAHIGRVTQLLDRFNTDQLNDLVGLIHASPEATAFTRDEAGVPGIIALQETRIGQRLDVAAARFLLTRFPKRPLPTKPGAKPAPPRESDETEPEVFSDDLVRDLYIRYHYNAILPGKDDPKPPDLPDEIRKNCIAIIHEVAPKLFTSEATVKKVEKSFKKLREKPKTHTIIHTGDALAGIGVADVRDEIKFKDAAGKETNGNTEPKTLVSSAWDLVMDKVGDDHGWHIFAMSVMTGHHSVTLFVDNQPGEKKLYWADQWRIDPGDNFSQLPGAISGFREYNKAGFDGFIETLTNSMWNKVHQPDSKCGQLKGDKWDFGCRYTATLAIWHLRKVVDR